MKGLTLEMGKLMGDVRMISVICQSPSSRILEEILQEKSLQMMIAAMKLKDTYSLEGKLWPT